MYYTHGKKSYCISLKRRYLSYRMFPGTFWIQQIFGVEIVNYRIFGVEIVNYQIVGVEIVNYQNFGVEIVN